MANCAKQAIWLVSQFHQAAEGDKCLMQAQVADQIIEPTLQHAIQVMPLRDFWKHLSGTAGVRTRQTRLADLVVRSVCIHSACTKKIAYMPIKPD